MGGLLDTQQTVDLNVETKEPLKVNIEIGKNTLTLGLIAVGAWFIWSAKK